MDVTPARDLTEAEITDYERDGAVCLRGIYSADWVAALSEVLDEFYAASTDAFPGVSPTFKQTLYHWFINDVVRDFVLYGPSARVAQQAMRSSKINFYYDQIFIKGAGTTDPTPWHHDITFWPLAGEKIATLWTSMDPVTAETSALEFVAGSHKWGRRYKPVAIGGLVVSEEKLEAPPEIEGDRSKFNIVSWDLEPGDALLFQACTIHGARGNASLVRPRRAIATRWCGDDVVYAPVEGQILYPRDPGLAPGSPLSGDMFPRVLPELDAGDVAARLAGPLHPDPALIPGMQERVARAERVAV